MEAAKQQLVPSFRFAFLGKLALFLVIAVAVIRSSESNGEILPQLLVNALITGSIYALASSGLSLSFGILRVINFAHGHLMMTGVYFYYLLTVEKGLGVLPASLGTVLFSILLGWICLRIFVTPFLHLSPLLSIVTTLTLANILEAGVSLLFDVNVKSLQPGSAAQGMEFGGVYVTPIQIVIIISAAVILSLVAFVMHSTGLGRRIRAIAENRYAAESLGTSLRSVSTLVFVASTLLAVYAGIMVGYETNIQPTMGNSYTIKAFAALILGGLGNFWGTIIGAYILGLIENLAIGLEFWGYSIPAGYKDAFAYVIILLVLLFKPEGLLRKKGRVA